MRALTHTIAFAIITTAAEQELAPAETHIARDNVSG